MQPASASTASKSDLVIIISYVRELQYIITWFAGQIVYHNFPEAILQTGLSGPLQIYIIQQLITPKNERHLLSHRRIKYDKFVSAAFRSMGYYLWTLSMISSERFVVYQYGSA
jgi:hypothetical protein